MPPGVPSASADSEEGRYLIRANAELVRRVFEAGPELERLLRGGGDVSAHPWLSLFHPACVVEDIRDLPDGRTFHGREGLVQFIRRGFDEVWDEWRFVPREIIEGTDGVMAAVHNSGRSKTGAEVEMEIFQVFRFRDGLIIHITAYLDRREAIKAVGLEGWPVSANLDLVRSIYAARGHAVLTTVTRRA